MTNENTAEQRVFPLSDRVFCRRVEAKEKEAGGIIIPDTAQEKSEEAVVVAVGPGKMLENGKIIPVNILPGVSVILPKFGGTEVDIHGEHFTIVHEDEIVCVIG